MGEWLQANMAFPEAGAVRLAPVAERCLASCGFLARHGMGQKHRQLQRGLAGNRHAQRESPVTIADLERCSKENDILMAWYWVRPPTVVG
jgi:hypothetical protein